MFCLELYCSVTRFQTAPWVKAPHCPTVVHRVIPQPGTLLLRMNESAKKVIADEPTVQCLDQPVVNEWLVNG